MSESIIVIGGSGHGRAVIDCIRMSGGEVFGILDDGLEPGTLVLDVPVLGNSDDWEKYKDHPFLIAIGHNGIRRRLAEKMQVRWATVIHPTAFVSSYATLGEGTIVMPQASVSACARVGDHCILNTGVVVEHDCVLGSYIHMSPNAAMGGTVTVGDETHIGLGSSMRNNISICGGCMIGAGAVVVKDITEPGTYVGVPARRIK